MIYLNKAMVSSDKMHSLHICGGRNTATNKYKVAENKTKLA